MSTHEVIIFGDPATDVQRCQSERIMSLDFTFSPYTKAETVLLAGWTAFYGEALNNGQTPSPFRIVWIDELTMEVYVTPPKDGWHEDYPDEVYTLKLEV